MAFYAEMCRIEGWNVRILRSKTVGHRIHVIIATHYSHLGMEHAEEAMQFIGDVMSKEITENLNLQSFSFSNDLQAKLEKE